MSCCIVYCYFSISFILLCYDVYVLYLACCTSCDDMWYD